MNELPSELRPRDFALLLLAAGDAAPRRRARDQQADRIGLDLKRRVLEELITSDPEPDGLPASLLAIVEKFGPPQGPTRSIASRVLEEWKMALAAPEWLAQLLDASIQTSSSGATRIGRHLPG